VPLFQILLIFAYSRGFMSILGTSLNALNKPHLNAAINWVLVPISIPVFLLGAWGGGVQGVAIGVTTVMGVGAAVWFWLATSKVLGYSWSSLVRPAVLPSGAACLSIAVALAAPSMLHTVAGPIDWEPWPVLLNALQPLVLLIVYGLAISVGSSGRIPYMLLELVETIVRRDSAKTHSVRPRLIGEREDKV
ncbi:MAG: hypothetical protein ABG776_13485, partial [Cyanobacteria bacterium J06555_13]